MLQICSIYSVCNKLPEAPAGIRQLLSAHRKSAAVGLCFAQEEAHFIVAGKVTFTLPEEKETAAFFALAPAKYPALDRYTIIV